MRLRGWIAKAGKRGLGGRSEDCETAYGLYEYVVMLRARLHSRGSDLRFLSFPWFLCEFMLICAKGERPSIGPVPFWYSKSMGPSCVRRSMMRDDLSRYRRRMCLVELCVLVAGISRLLRL